MKKKKEENIEVVFGGPSRITQKKARKHEGGLRQLEQAIFKRAGALFWVLRGLLL